LANIRNIKLVIEYDGTDYIGWQVQKIKSQRSKIKINTIQETIEKTLEKILQEKVKLIGAGRTDSGVHALAQVANFKTKSRLSAANIHRALNSILPQDIVIKGCSELNLKFHSRFDAKSKVYRYTILSGQARSVFHRRFCYHIPYPLDVNLMKKEARVLLGRHDFSSFMASDKKKRQPVREIKSLEIVKKGRFIYIDIEADGFLYNMARNIVGTLIEIGRGKFVPGSLKKILKAKDRSKAGPTAPAKGLCLMEVKY
jgi:tRNA pseudouridine38-40 synthase